VVWDLAQQSQVAFIDLPDSYYYYKILFQPHTNRIFWRQDYFGLGLSFLDVDTGEEGLIVDELWVSSFDFSPDGSVLAVAVRGQIFFYNIDTLEVIETFLEPDATIPSITFSTDGTLFAALVEGTVKVWEVKTFQEVASTSLDSAYDGYQLAFDTAQRVWLMDTHDHAVQPILDTTTGRIWQLEWNSDRFGFSRDGTLIVELECSGNQLLLYDTLTNALQATTSFGDTSCGGYPYGVFEFSTDGTVLVAGTGGDSIGDDDGEGDNLVRLWDTVSGELLAQRIYQGDVDVIRFSPDGTLLAIGSENHTVSLWGISE
jgi:WD40 repeat protein